MTYKRWACRMAIWCIVGFYALLAVAIIAAVRAAA